MLLFGACPRVPAKRPEDGGGTRFSPPLSAYRVPVAACRLRTRVMPVSALAVAFARAVGILFVEGCGARRQRPIAVPGAAAGGLEHGDAASQQPRRHLGRRMAEAVEVAGLHDGHARPHGVEEGFARRGAAAM